MKHSVLLILGLFLISCNNSTEHSTEPLASKVHTTDESVSVLRHVVLFKFKETSTEEQINTVVKAFENLPSQIPEIIDFEYGTNNSPEGLNKGLTHCFLLTFQSEKGRDTYLPHPAHKEFGKILGPHLDDVTVVDYWSK